MLTVVANTQQQELEVAGNIPPMVRRQGEMKPVLIWLSPFYAVNGTSSHGTRAWTLMVFLPASLSHRHAEYCSCPWLFQIWWSWKSRLTITIHPVVKLTPKHVKTKMYLQPQLLLTIMFSCLGHSERVQETFKYKKGMIYFLPSTTENNKINLSLIYKSKHIPDDLVMRNYC